MPISDLQDIAFRFQIDPIATIGHAARVSSVIHVLSSINQSYLNFLEIEFFKNEQFAKAYESNPKVLDSLKVDLELLLVDLKFGSFEAAAAPNVLEKTSLFNDTVNAWKRETFHQYKEDVLYADYFDVGYAQKTVGRFTEEERTRIFKPLFAAVNTDRYKLNILDRQGKPRKVLYRPEAWIDIYVPKPQLTQQPADEYHTVSFVAQVRKNDGAEGYNINKRTVKQILFAERLEHETYPFKPNVIQFDDLTYVLTKSLPCVVSYEDGAYLIENERLHLSVWGETREEAENAFAFAFHSVYQNFAEEADEELSDEAKALKADLLALVKIKK